MPRSTPGPENPNPTPTPAKLPWPTLWAVLGIFLFTASGRVGNADSGLMLALTRALLKGTVNVEGDFDTVTGANGLPVSHYGLLTFILWIPPVLVGRFLGTRIGIGSVEKWEELCVGFTVPLIAWAVLLLVCIEWRRSGLQQRSATFGLLLFSFSTLLFPYSKREGSDLPMTLALLAGWWLVPPGTRGLRLIACGFCFGLAFLARMPAAVLLPPLTLAVVIGRAGLTSVAGVSRGVLLVLTGFLPGAVIHFAYNHLRYGTPWTIQYVHHEPWLLLPISRWLGNAADTLLDPVHGWIPYGAVAITVFVIAWPILRRTQPAIAWLAPALVLAETVLLSGYSFWGGSVGFGSRFFVFLIPFAALAWPACLQALDTPRRALLLAIALVWFPINLVGVLVDPLFPHRRHEIDGTTVPLNYYRELARFAGWKWGQPSAALAASPDFNHPPLQHPDLWWWHALDLRRNRLLSHDLRKSLTP
jgi:hypothetical protein